jgi:hypothetical protein
LGSKTTNCANAGLKLTATVIAIMLAVARR